MLRNFQKVVELDSEELVLEPILAIVDNVRGQRRRLEMELDLGCTCRSFVRREPLLSF